MFRLSPFGQDKVDRVLDKARVHEREQQDGVLAISVFVASAGWTESQIRSLLRDVPVSGRWAWRTTRTRLAEAGFGLTWDPTQATERHYLIAFGNAHDDDAVLLDTIKTLVAVFDDRERNPGEL